MSGLYAELRRHWPSYLLLWVSPFLHVASVVLTPRVEGWHAWMQFVVPAYMLAALVVALRRCVAGVHKASPVVTVLFADIVPTALGLALVASMAPVLLAALRDLVC